MVDMKRHELTYVFLLNEMILLEIMHFYEIPKHFSVKKNHTSRLEIRKRANARAKSIPFVSVIDNVAAETYNQL